MNIIQDHKAHNTIMVNPFLTEYNTKARASDTEHVFLSHTQNESIYKGDTYPPELRGIIKLM
jgi:hypothetical protein